MRQKLEIENPAFAAEWDCEKNAGLNIDDYTGGSNKYVWWRCAKHGHSWRAQINKRFSRGQNCRICGNHEVLAGFNDIATTHRHLADEWHRGKNGVKFPQHYTQGADIKVWWKCSKCGYEWEAAIYSRTSKKPTGWCVLNKTVKETYKSKCGGVSRRIASLRKRRGFIKTSFTCS